MTWLSPNKKLYTGYLKLCSTLLLSLILVLTGSTQELLTSATEIETRNRHNKQTRSNQVGKFILQYERTSYTSIRQQLQTNKIFDTIITGLNGSGLVMRQDIQVIFRDCNEPNAFWDSSNGNIIMCYELIDFAAGAFYKVNGDSIAEAKNKSLGNAVFTFYHELGHALIDVLQLNAVGQEEDTVDEFAAVMLSSNYKVNLADIILDAAEFYQVVAQISESPPWGEHAPHDKRLFNLVCFVYGSDPQKYEKIFIEKFVLVDPDQKVSQQQLESRAARCRQEFPQKVANWNKLLLPHYSSKNNSQPASNSPNNSPGVSRRGTYW